MPIVTHNVADFERPSVNVTTRGCLLTEPVREPDHGE